MDCSVWDQEESQSRGFLKLKQVSVTLSLSLPQSCRWGCNLMPEPPTVGSSSGCPHPHPKLPLSQTVGSLWALQCRTILVSGAGQQRAAGGEPFLFHSLYSLLLPVFGSHRNLIDPCRPCHKLHWGGR